jgi:hypothetical protein
LSVRARHITNEAVRNRPADSQARRSLNQGVVQDFGRMQRYASGAIFDLMPAACSRRRDDRFGRGRSHSRQKHEHSNLH